MFQSAELNEHLQTSHTVEARSLVYAEWNLNQPDNIARIGNYRYRPASGQGQYETIPATYDVNDSGNYYTGATDSDIAIDGGYNDNGDPLLFTLPKNKMKMLYSLEDCFKPFRPRSGINKMLYLGINGGGYTQAQYIDATTANSATRPRYYVSSRYDQFKYWTSYRNESIQGLDIFIPEFPFPVTNNEYGVSLIPVNGRSYIYDAAPFVVYSDNLPINRLVFKMQTNVGDTNLGDIRIGDTVIPDPLYGTENQTTPVRWRIDVLKGTNWVTIKTFDENSQRSDGTAIIKSDGYVELSYGLKIPDQYKDIFTFAGTLSSIESLPTSAPEGYAYLLKINETDRGSYYIYYDAGWQIFYPEYEWDIAEDFISKNSNFVSDVTNPDYFINENTKIYREIDLINGIRIVVDTMNKPNCTFDLIEMSPRLAVDMTDRVQSFSVTKTLSDLGNGSIPVGSLLAGTGDIVINNNDYAFNPNNEFDIETSIGSLVAKYLLTNIKFSFYEIVKNVNNYDYYVPLKTMYSEGFPQSEANFDQIQMSLRDAYFIFESNPAPSLMLSDISLSNAIMVLLDYIGFSNYVFKRIDGQQDPIIPYFFVAPNQNVAEILNQLAVATQCAMFFDEYNNFVVMTKEYLLPDNDTRTVDLTLFGNEIDNKLPNIISVSSSNKNVNNNGAINYTKRYIQRSYGSVRQAMYNDEFKTWTYVPTLVWEVTGDQSTKAANENATEQSAYSLAALALAADLTSAVPTVVNNNMTNNILYVGENIYFHARYAGYLYANGEIIKYDAIEYSITGQTTPIWINNVDEYQEYFLNLPFNGKMYPTGNIRIWSEPEYITVDGVTIMKPGPAKQHGRGQFGTEIVEHKAGLDSYWENLDNVYGCQQQADYLFTTNQIVTYPLNIAKNTAGGVSRAKSLQSTRTGLIKNTLSQVFWTENQNNEFPSGKKGSLQSSALVFTGPNFDDIPATASATINQRGYVSYIHKPLNNAYRHFGTRMRIIGKIESGSNKVQTPIGSTQYFTVNPNNPAQQINISGGSGGIGVMVDKNTNNGYYFEIIALTENNVSSYYDSTKKQIVSYAIPVGNVSLSGSGNRIVKITTTVDHQFKVGDKVVVSGFIRNGSNSAINGQWTITAVTARTFTYDTALSIPGPPTTGGTAEIYIDSGLNINNIIFYKVVGSPDGKAYPIKLWSGLANILVDSGRFVGQYRTIAEQNPTVYDLAVEYKDTGSTRTFYLYINDKQVATVVDNDPLQKTNSAALFVRGSSKCMFENIYALAENYAQIPSATAIDKISEAFGDSEITSNEALRKYAVSGFIQAAYLSNVSTYEPPKYNIYYDEFGTIMREVAHFNIKYDRAYPALYARLAPTLNRIKTYSTSGFYAGAYGADFLVFNCTDKTINLDATSGNFLRIQGIVFTQNTTKTLTVDDYFNKIANLSDPQLDDGNLVYSPLHNKEIYNQIKISRIKHGIKEFTIDSPYIQSDSAANNIMGWIMDKTMVPKQTVGLSTFATQTLQLGDVVNLYYKDDDGLDFIAPETRNFVVYNIEYSRSFDQINTTVYLAEV